ncbi:MAG: sodium/solute symporter [Planctomycetota bacterium]
MGEIFTTIDLVIFFALLVAVMAVGLIAGRSEKKDSSEDYFLAGRKIRWFGVAGSIFGSNVSANHIVGMLGIGFSVGFAQAHFELGAIAGLMVLCYGFLPVYRKLRVYTLSEYLGRRYNDSCRVLYTVIMILIMAVVQMGPGLYIGARTICIFLGGDALVEVAAEGAAAEGAAAEGAGAADVVEKTNLQVSYTYYTLFVVAMALISSVYTIFGGLKAVVWTDVLQSVLLLIAGVIVAVLTFSEIGGWSGMMERDAASDGKMHLYLPSNHPDLPWTGVLSGLMMMHFFYWGTNQFIVQRALGARSDTEAKLGIMTAGFGKLLIPFFAIGTGVAAYYVFQEKMPDRAVDPDAAFPELVKLLVPAGWGLVGLISAGVLGAILSSIDSMMNSAATLVTVDIYQRFFRPDATDREMIVVGRISIVVFVVLAALVALFVIDPNSKQNFFLQIVNQQHYLAPGILVAFLVGMFWSGATGAGALAAIVSGVAFSLALQKGYDNVFGTTKDVAAVYDASRGWFDPENVRSVLGNKLNMFHRTIVVVTLCIATHVIVSKLTTKDPEKSKLTWTDLGGHEPNALRNVFLGLAVSIALFAVLGALMVYEVFAPGLCASVACIWTLSLFVRMISKSGPRSGTGLGAWIGDDRLWAGILSGLAMFCMYWFY